MRKKRNARSVIPFPPTSPFAPKSLIYKTLFCPILPQPGPIIQFILTFFLKPELIKIVAYIYPNGGAGPYGSDGANPGRELATVEKQFGVGTPGPCSGNQIGLCFQWPLEEDGQKLQLTLTDKGLYMLALFPPRSLMERDVDAYKKSLPDKF